MKCIKLSISLVSAALFFGGGVAHADPPGNSPDDPPNGRAFCAMVDKEPTPSGMRAALDEIFDSDLSKDARVDAVMYGVLYICPDYRELLEQILDEKSGN